jgi:hypothetical protein
MNIKVFLFVSIYYFLGLLYGLLLTYPDQSFSPLTIISHVSTNEYANELIMGVAYLPYDSDLYFADALNFRFSDISFTSNFLEILAGSYQNIILYSIAKIAHYISPQAPFWIVVLINHLLFTFALINYLKICKILNINSTPFIIFLFPNILILFTLFSLNKEVLGIYLVSEFILFSYKPNKLRVIIILFLALLTRNVFFAFGLLVFINQFFRFKFTTIFLIFAAVILPILFYLTNGAILGERFGELSSAAAQWQQQSHLITSFFYEYIKYPMGYFLNYFVVLIVNILAPALNSKYWSDYFYVINLSQLFLQLSSVLFSCYLLRIFFSLGWNFLHWQSPFKFFVYYTMIVCVFPFSQHRYLIPIFPVVVLSLLYHLKKIKQVN